LADNRHISWFRCTCDISLSEKYSSKHAVLRQLRAKSSDNHCRFNVNDSANSNTYPNSYTHPTCSLTDFNRKPHHQPIISTHGDSDSYTRINAFTRPHSNPNTRTYNNHSNPNKHTPIKHTNAYPARES
jgi:hypothetical protein